MNKLLFILPADPAHKNDALTFCHELTAFLDHEKYQAYWDEAQYKELRGKIDNTDRVSQGNRRLKLLDFTDYRHLPKPPTDLTIMAGDTDCTATIYGCFVAHRQQEQSGQSGKIALVQTSTVAIPKILKIWNKDVQQQPQYTAPLITDCPSAHRWFADYRMPRRIFNPDYRHGKKEYNNMGKNVSPLNISENQRDHALKHAVGCKTTDRLMYHYPELGLYIIFSYENREVDGCSIYHGHQFPDTDKAEFNRLPPELTRKLKNYLVPH